MKPRHLHLLRAAILGEWLVGWISWIISNSGCCLLVAVFYPQKRLARHFHHPVWFLEKQYVKARAAGFLSMTLPGFWMEIGDTQSTSHFNETNHDKPTSPPLSLSPEWAKSASALHSSLHPSSEPSCPPEAPQWIWLTLIEETKYSPLWGTWFSTCSSLGN